MGLISAYVDQDDLGGGRFQNTIAMKPIAYLQGGSLLRMVQDWEDSGDSTRQHIVTRAPLMVSGGNDGLRRFHPTRDINKYIEIGAPFVQIAGNWTQVNLGTPTRANRRLSWHTANADFSVEMGGHFCKLEIELLNGYVPQNSRVAFPASLSGLTRSGTAILDGSNVVANLRPFVIYDAANPLDIRTITHQFTNLSGNPYLLLTLPSLTGMSRPVIDPTLTLQPDATAGGDAFISSTVLTINYGTSIYLPSGRDATSGFPIDHVLIKFDLSSIPSASTISSATLTLTESAIVNRSLNARTHRIYRMIRAWVEGTKNGSGTADGATWDKFDGTTNWGTAGAENTTSDREATDIGSVSLPATPVAGTVVNITLTAAGVQGWTSGAFTNNGMLMRSDTESGDAHLFVSSDDTTAANRPKFVVVYTVAALAFPFQSRPLYVWNQRR